MHHAIEDARHYARETTRDPWLIAVWVMEFRTLSTYQGRQWLRAQLRQAVIDTRQAMPEGARHD